MLQWSSSSSDKFGLISMHCGLLEAKSSQKTSERKKKVVKTQKLPALSTRWEIFAIKSQLACSRGKQVVFHWLIPNAFPWGSKIMVYWLVLNAFPWGKQVKIWFTG